MGVYQNLTPYLPGWKLCLFQQQSHPVYGYKRFKHRCLEGDGNALLRSLVTNDLHYWFQVPPADDKNRHEKEYQTVTSQKLRLETSTADLQKKLAKINDELRTAK